MDNFDKLFHDKLDEITENDFVFKESSWERFHGQWQAENEPKRRFIPMVWVKRNVTAAAVILLLLMSNVFFAQQFLGTRSDVKKLTSTIEDLRSDIISCQENTETHSKAVASLETQLKKQTIVISEQTDEIKKQSEKIINQNRASFLPIFPNNNGINNNAINNNGIVNTTIANNNTNNTVENGMSFLNNPANNSSNNSGTNNNTNTEIVENSASNNAVNSGTTTSNTANTATTNGTTNNVVANNTSSSSANNSSNNAANSSSISELDRLVLIMENEKSSNVYIKKRPIPVVENEHKVSLGTRLYMLGEAAKPSAYQVGVNSMFTFIPITTDLPSMTMVNGGITANALFFKRLRLQIGANYWGQAFETDDIANSSDAYIQSFTNAYPTVNSFNPLDKLNKVEAKTSGLDIPIVAQIMLRPDAKFNPYIGFGLVGRYYNDYKLEYYYLDNATGYEYEVKDYNSISSFDFGMWQGQLGMDYYVFNNWIVNFEINYLKSFKQQSFGLSDIQQYGATLGVKYQF